MSKAKDELQMLIDDCKDTQEELRKLITHLPEEEQKEFLCHLERDPAELTRKSYVRERREGFVAAIRDIKLKIGERALMSTDIPTTIDPVPAPKAAPTPPPSPSPPAPKPAPTPPAEKPPAKEMLKWNSELYEKIWALQGEFHRDSAERVKREELLRMDIKQAEDWHEDLLQRLDQRKEDRRKKEEERVEAEVQRRTASFDEKIRRIEAERNDARVHCSELEGRLQGWLSPGAQQAALDVETGLKVTAEGDLLRVQEELREANEKIEKISKASADFVSKADHEAALTEIRTERDRAQNEINELKGAQPAPVAQAATQQPQWKRALSSIPTLGWVVIIGVVAALVLFSDQLYSPSTPLLDADTEALIKKYQ